MSEATPTSPATPRLRAVTRRVPRRPSAGPADGGEGAGHPDEVAPPEPNIRLTRALGVMLLLHLVAAGGVLAFASIKDRPIGAGKSRPAKANRTDPRVTSPPDAGSAVPMGNAPTPYPAATAPSAAIANAAPAPGAGRATPTPALSRAEADAVRLIESGGPNPAGGGERAYVVGRGETVQTIAQKLRVEPAALLRLNGIDDPRKIQPGQRLRVPAPSGRSRP